MRIRATCPVWIAVGCGGRLVRVSGLLRVGGLGGAARIPVGAQILRLLLLMVMVVMMVAVVVVAVLMMAVILLVVLVA